MCRLIAAEELWALLDALQEQVPVEVHQHLETISVSTTPLMVCVCGCVCVSVCVGGCGISANSIGPCIVIVYLAYTQYCRVL